MFDTKVTIFFHSSDLDGQFSGFLTTYAILQELDTQPSCSWLSPLHGMPMVNRLSRVHLVPINYDQPIPDGVPLDGYVYVLDFSFPMETMVRLREQAEVLVWVDHHKTVIERQAEFEEAFNRVEGGSYVMLLDPDRSACEIVADMFKDVLPETFMNSARYLGRYDVWDTSGEVIPWEDLLSYQYAARTLPSLYEPCTLTPKDAKAWEWLLKMEEYASGDPRRHLLTGEWISSYERRRMEKARRNTLDVYFAGHPAKLYLGYESQLFDKGIDWGGSKVGVMIFFSPENKRMVFSLRSLDGETDVAEIAKAHGGGGHAGAAGFSLPVHEAFELLSTMMEERG